jgi:hypothetical protein
MKSPKQCQCGSETIGAVIFALLTYDNGNGAHPAVGFAHTKITGENDHDAEPVLLQHQGVKLC